jgi:hypothetical protein
MPGAAETTPDRLRIGLTFAAPPAMGGTLDDSRRRAVDEAAQLLTRMGHEAVPRDPVLPRLATLAMDAGISTESPRTSLRYPSSSASALRCPVLRSAEGTRSAPDTTSPPVEQLLGSVGQRQSLGDAGQGEKPLHLLGSVDQTQPPAVLLCGLMSPDENAQPRGIHELELPKVDDHHVRARLGHAFELLLQRWARRQVELAADADHGRVVGVADLYPEMTLHGAGERTDLRSDVLESRPLFGAIAGSAVG